MNITKLFQQYTSAFDSLDPQSIADLYMLPCATSDADGAQVFTERASLIKKFNENCISMKVMEYRYAKFNILDEIEMGDLVRAVTIGWCIYTESTKMEFRSLYICHLKKDEWRIFSVNVYPGSFTNDV